MHIHNWHSTLWFNSQRERERERVTSHYVTSWTTDLSFQRGSGYNAIWCCHRQLSCAQGMTVGRALGTTEDVLLKTHIANKHYQTAVCTIRTYVNKPHKWYSSLSADCYHRYIAMFPHSSPEIWISNTFLILKRSQFVPKLHRKCTYQWKTSLVTSPRAPPSKKRSGERSRISWAYYPKAVRTNEIARSVIIM